MDRFLHTYSLHLAFVAACLYIIAGAIYRLRYSPIARYPGPRLAALTFWYEFYYDVICKGRYSWRIQELHRIYGPIVRINPQELHVVDPTFYDSVYVGPGRKTEKWGYSARMFGTTMAAVGTIGHDLHRLRRGALNNFFSKRAVTKLEPTIHQIVDNGCNLLRNRGADRHILNLRNYFAAFSADVIGQVAFGNHYGLLDREDFEPGWQKLMMDLSRGTHLMKQFPWAYPLLKIIPSPVVSMLHPPGTRLFKIRNDIRLKIEETRQSLVSNAAEEDKNMTAANLQPTALHTLLTSALPDIELQTARVEDEAFTLLGAGTITTAHTLTTIMYYLLANPSIKQKLENEMDDLHANNPRETPSPTLVVLENASYLQAIVAEGLRLSFGVSHRLPRISPDAPLHYTGVYDGQRYDYLIPPGVPVSMTPMFMHLDPAIFPSPCTFDPQRWIPSSNTPEEKEHLRKKKSHLVPFSKGTRSCAGMWLAYAELYLMIGTLFEPGGVGRQMELFETELEDVQCVHDFFNPSPNLDSLGVRVLLKN